MKKTIMVLMIGILLIGVDLYAAGDLIVNGQVGVGVSNPTARLHVENTNANAYQATSVFDDLSGAGFTRASSSFTTTVSDADWNNKKIIGFNGGMLYTGRATGADAVPPYAELRGFQSELLFSSTVAGAHSLTEVASAKYRLAISSINTQGVTINEYYGIKHTYEDSGGSGTFSGDNWYGMFLGNPDSSDFQPTNLNGLYIEKQTRGTNNYGIVLDGDGAGADIVFGASQQASIYSSAGLLYATDMNGNITQFSPHDPETGEWIYYSKNTKTGVVKRVDMERLVKAVERLTGETFMVESLIED